MAGMDMDSVKVNNRAERVKLSDVIEVFDFKAVKGWSRIRLFGPIFADANYWVTAKRGSNKKFCVPCPSFNRDTDQRDYDAYDPWDEAMRSERDANVDSKKRMISYQKYYYMLGIVRSEQENEPKKNRISPEEAKSGFKRVDSEAWTPVKVIRLTSTLLSKIQAFKEDNLVKTKSGEKYFNIDHQKFGRDVLIKFDGRDGVAPGDRWQAKLDINGSRTPLTEEELGYLKYDIEHAFPAVADAKEIKRDFDSWAKRVGFDVKPEDSNEDEEEFETPKKVKHAAKEEDADFEDDSNATEDEDAADEDESPKKKSKRKVEEDDPWDEDDSEETPKKKSKKSKVEEDDDEDDSEDDSEDDEDDDSEDESEDEDDGFDDDEEEEPKPKKSKKSKKSDDEEDW